MSTSNLIHNESSSNTWFHRWIFYLAVGFMFAAAALRSILVYQKSPLIKEILLLLAAWLPIFIGNALFAHRLHRFSYVLISLEVIIVLQLLLLTRADFFAFLFALPIMQVMQQFTLKETVVLIGLTTLLTFLTLFQSSGIFYAIAIAVVFFGGSSLLVVYIGSTRRARSIQDQQQTLVSELLQANHKLESYAQQLQQLAAGRERQHLARELHDSVTQTIFSMTLTIQTTLLLLDRDRTQLVAQLDRLDLLAHNALTEMQTLISKLAPEKAGGFVSTLQQHLDERHRLDNLTVSLDMEGSKSLTVREEQSLFRIAQEALNNVVKHAGVTQATIHLHLDGQPWLEIEDRGVGFDPRLVIGVERVGLASMQERAVEIGWSLKVESSCGNGTRIWVQKDSGE